MIAIYTKKLNSFECHLRGGERDKDMKFLVHYLLCVLTHIQKDFYLFIPNLQSNYSVEQTFLKTRNLVGLLVRKKNIFLFLIKNNSIELLL